MNQNKRPKRKRKYSMEVTRKKRLMLSDQLLQGNIMKIKRKRKKKLMKILNLHKRMLRTILQIQ